MWDSLFVSDSIWEITYPELAFRMFVATALGGLIGIEREWNNHPAGFRTHILVCLGSATLMLLSIYGFSQYVTEANVRIDPARLAAQVVSGIGFLGAGAILRNGSMVTGLTTAASVWVVASIGLCVGAGFYKGAITAAVLVLISLHLFNRWEKRLMRNRRYHDVCMRISGVPNALPDIIKLFGNNEIAVRDVKVLADSIRPDADAWPLTEVAFQLKTRDTDTLIAVLAQAAGLGYVQAIESPLYDYGARKQAAGTAARL